MTERSDLGRTVDESPPDPLEAGLAAAFGPDSGPPLPAAGSVAQALGAAPVQLRLPDTEPADPIVRPHSDAVPAKAPARLQLHGEIARGGMGAVLKGRDTDLGRDVAVKVLLEAHAGRTELVQRFVEEAQVAGQLQHPGVVPVYEMGQLPDRRPYFTMKLVKGQTLAQLLAQRQGVAQGRPRLLKVFEQVCQALAYAHARGVIHRDLKPSNVMVGAFGEVQVMDWGLAKVLKQGGAADEKAPPPAEATVIRTARAGSATPTAPGPQTQAGAVLGTPAYMAPEQARGEVEALDERCDVFGLGAILCQILTGQPPYAGSDAEQVFGLASRAELAGAFARLDRCGADAELIGLARRCLCADPASRPQDAGALAAELNAYLGSVEARLRRAELDRAAAEARAVEEGKRRRVQLALAAAVLALVAVGAGGGLFVQQQAAERRADQARHEAEQRQAIESALEKAASLREQARWGEAQAVLGQARLVLSDSGPGDLRQRLDVAEAELALVNRLDAIRQRRATGVEVGATMRTAALDYAAAFKEAGLGEVGHDEETVAERVRASGVAGPLVAALDDWAWVADEPEARSWLLGVARRAAPDPWGDRFHDPAVWQDRQALRALADDALRDGGAKLGELSPQVLAALGRLLGGSAEGVALLRAAQRRHPGDFWLNLHLALLLSAAKQSGEAVGYCRVAVALRPDSIGAHNNLGTALSFLHDPDGAIAEFKTAIALDPEFALSHYNLGNVLREKGDPDGAIPELRRAIELDPEDAAAALAHIALGLILYDQKDPDGAIAEYRRAIELDPDSSIAHTNLGNALRAKKDLDGAVAEYRKAIALDPAFAATHNGLGATLFDQKKVNEAIAEYRRAIKLEPGNAPAHTNLGNALLARNDVDGAIAAHRRAIELNPKYAKAFNNLGIALRKKDLDGAIAAFRQATILDPRYAVAHTNLGLTLRDKKDLEGAVAEHRKAIKLDPKDGNAYGALGQALLDQGRFAEAQAATRRGLELLPEGDPLRRVESEQLQLCERLLALDETLSVVLKGNAEPAGTVQRMLLGRLCWQYKHLHVTAVRLYAEAFAAEPALAADLQGQHRYDGACSAALAAAGQAEDARHLPDKARLLLRRQALQWLRADLAAYRPMAERGDAKAREFVRQNLAHWRQDADLASVRDKAALEGLPDDERAAWRALWADVDALLRTVAP